MRVNTKNPDLQTMPGHLVRRVHQAAVALYAQELKELRLTPIQYASLQAIGNQPGIDQKTLAATIGIDTSTVAGVIDRMETRGLVVRNVAPNDRRARLITPTKEGVAVLEAAVPRVLRSQDRLLASLSQAECQDFMRLMRTIVDSNAEFSTVPAKD